MPGNGLRTAQEQDTVGGEGVVEGGNHAGARFGVQIDRHIAAGDQVHPRKWRIARQAVRRESTQRAWFRAHRIPAAIFPGDSLHQPMQVFRPDWNSRFCEMASEARATRRSILDYCHDRNALLLPAH